MKIIFAIILVWVVSGIFFPTIPFPVKNGWHSAGGEFCGIVYRPDCDKTSVKFVTLSEIKVIIDNKMY